MSWVECPNCGVLYRGEHTCSKEAEKKWAKEKLKEVKREYFGQVTVEEMRHALDGMIKQLSLSWERKQLVPLPALGSPLFESALYAAKTTMKDATERRVFIQDFAAALNRRALLDSELIDAFSKHGYVYMEAASEHSSNSEGEVRESYRTPEEAEKARQRGRIGYEFVRIEPLPPVKWVVVWRRSEASEHSSSHSSAKKKFAVRYLDNMGREHTEEIEDDVAFYQRVRREGLSVISIHKIKY